MFPPAGQVGLIYNMQQSSHRLECSYIVRYCDLQSVVRHTASEVVEIQLYRSFDESSLLSCCLLLYKRPLPPRESVRDEKVLWALSPPRRCRSSATKTSGLSPDLFSSGPTATTLLEQVRIIQAFCCPPYPFFPSIDFWLLHAVVPDCKEQIDWVVSLNIRHALHYYSMSKHRFS